MRMPRLVRSLESAALGVLLLAAPADGQETTRVSVKSSGEQGNGNSALSAISADGRIVAFSSDASNLVAGDTNGTVDVFVHRRSAGITRRVSVDSSGVQGNGDSLDPSISADGLIVAFGSYASNLVSGDRNGYPDIFVHDRSTGITERVSVDSSGKQGNSDSYDPSISADGQIVAFYSHATNLVASDTNGTIDVFVHDRSTGLTERVSVNLSGAEGNSQSELPSISADGQIVAFESYASNLVAGDTNGFFDIFVHDRSTGRTKRVSVDSSGAEGNSHSELPSISADGQIVTFHSAASNLVVGDTNVNWDVFVHDPSTGITERVSVDSSGAEGNGASFVSAISSDGQIVAFESVASNLVAGDTNGVVDAFVHDRSTGITERVSVDSSGKQGNSSSEYPSISADGQIVAFQSRASNLVVGDTNGNWDVFVHERCAIDATWTNYGAGFPGTNGVPSFTSRSDPVLGTTLTLDLANSHGASTVGLLFAGFQRTQIHLSLGGDLLVVPVFMLVVGLPPGGTSIIGDIPIEHELCGFPIDLQALELDPGAANGVSFTPGLELLLGH